MKGQEPILDGKLPARVIVDESLWELSEESDHKLLTIELLKENQSEWWNRIADGEPIINTSKVEPEESKLSDLDGEMRSTVEKMMVYILYYQFDQQQKARGLPTSDELKKQEMLKKFMEAVYI